MGLGGVLGGELYHRGVSPDRGSPTLRGCSSPCLSPVPGASCPHEVGSEGPHLVWGPLVIPS